ncbi:TldD/PmbA family protein [Anaeromyxobacter oryzisoli]|uniref:TldD/PmbA family protein n=1 Tax=Anaeromyxobacter oryzisoli TaxID=2925408 RepID=UPI001F5735CD|nr:metallopeptidase TldD-related protein [Anaeromyxobacter sp. SG63]
MTGQEAGRAGGPREGIGYFARFGVTERMIAETLAAALSRGADHADVFFQHRVGSDLGLEDGAVNRAYASVELGVGVRAVKGDQTGYGYTEDLSLPALLECARTAAAIADGPARSGPTRLHIRADLPDRYPLVRPWEDVRPDEKLPLVAALNERAFAADPRVKKVSVFLRDESGAVLVADSSGRIAEDLQPMTLLYLSVLAEDGGRREQNGYNVAGRAGFEFYTPERLDRVVKEAVARTAILFEAGAPPAGELPVVLAAGSSGILLHEAIGHGMEADFNRKGVSIYADKIGKAVARPFVNIVDDAANPGARGAINVDDEGNAAGTTRLVENGVLATYLHDGISAHHYGVAPTGNGRRESYRYPPLPRMRSTYMLPGPHAKDEIIRSVKRGIYCVNFSNGQVNIGAGDFTFYVKNGWLIEDGKLTRPVKDVNIIGNGPKALEQVDMVSDDLAIDEGGWTCGKDGQSVPVSQGLPTVRVAKMTVGGRG